MDAAPTDARLYKHLLALAVLVHALNSPRSLAPAVSSLAVTAPTTQPVQLPKGAVKALMNHFKALATAGTAQTAKEAVFRRRVYLALYAQLLEMKQTSSSDYEDVCRRLEALMARFMLCVSKELQNFTELGPQKFVVSREGTEFLALLQNVATKQLRASAVPPQFPSQLNAYQKAHFNSDDEGTRVENISKTPLGQAVQKVCLVSAAQLQRDATQIVPSSVVAGAKRDLNTLLTDLERANWGNSIEAADLRALIMQLSATSASPMEFIPRDTGAYYGLLVKRALEADETSGDLGEGPKNLLVQAAKWWHLPESTQAVAVVIRAQNVAAANAPKSKRLSAMPANAPPDRDPETVSRAMTLIADALNFANTLTVRSGSRTRDWPQEESHALLTGMDSVRQLIVYSLVAIFRRICQNKKPPKVGPFLQALDSLQISDVDLSAPTPAQVKQLKQAILKSAESAYDEYLGALPRDATLDIDHIVVLAETIVAGVERLQKRYKQPLLGELPIAKLVCVRQVSLFGTDFMPMYGHCMQAHEANNDTPDFSAMQALHAVVAQLQSLLEQCALGQELGFNIEDTLYPYFAEWADSTVAVSRSWVESAIVQDSFTPIDDTTKHSTSVKDLFSSFYATVQLVERLNWGNQYHVAKLFTRVIAGVSASLCDWASRLLIMFLEDMKPLSLASSGTGSGSGKHREKWLSFAKEAMASAQAAAAEATGHYAGQRVPPPPPETNFGSQACVRLNDVAAAYTLLNKMEESVDADAVAKRIELEERLKGGHSNAPSYLFTVTIKGAQSLKTYGDGSYVTLIDQDNRKRLGKTRTVLSGNPSWDQSFELEVSAGRPRLLKATVWAESVATNHELCGRVLIKLDPKEFAGRREFGTRSYWADLDSEGQLLIQVSMDLRREDIRFYFGQALRFLKRTREDMINAIVNQFALYIEAVVSLPTLKSLAPSRTSTGLQTLNAWWSSTTQKAETNVPPPPVDMTTRTEDSLQPLFDYMNAVFSTLASELTDELRVEVMGRTWDCVLEQIELLILPRLEAKRTSQQPLTGGEMEAVYIWLRALRDFFHADGAGPDLERLQSQAYQQIMAIPVYYDLPIAQLRAESEKITKQGLRNYTHNAEMMIRQHSVMAHRSRSVIEKQAADLRRAQRAAPRLDEVILRILRLRNDIQFVEQQMRQRDRLMQKETTERAIQGLV